MKKVFLYAYDGQNLGDDLFIHTIVKRYPHVQFYMRSDPKNRENLRFLRNLKVLDLKIGPYRFLNRIRSSLVHRYRVWWEKRCVATVYIGGSIFIEHEDWSQYLQWWDSMAQSRDFYVLGANFGPYHTEAYRECISRIYARMKDVCFRDQYSLKLFSDVKTVRQAPDILLAYPMPQVAVQEKQIFVSVIHCGGRAQSHDLTQYEAGYVENMARLLTQYRQEGYRLVLSSFCAPENDEEGIVRILKAMGAEQDPSIRILRYDGTNADQLTTAIAESEFVVATRFHAMILAMAADRPVLPLIYSDKTIHVLEDLHFDGPVIDIRSCEDYTAVGRPTRSVVDCRKLAQEAQKHFEQLDKVLR